MTTIIVKINPFDGISSEIDGREKGKLIAERSPRFGVEDGMGYGGGESLTFAAGVCFYNNIRRVANDTDLVLANVEVEATAETRGDPPGMREVILKPKIVSDASEEEIREVVNQALEMSYVADMLRQSVKVQLERSE